MELLTKNFGVQQIDEDKIITFQDGILGFSEYKKFIILTEDDINISTIWWLQSVENGELAFPLLNTFSVLKDYTPEVDDSLIVQLGEFEEDSLVVANILVVPEDAKKMTVNLKAPVIINIKTKKGMQVIVNNNEYEVKFPIYSVLQKQKAGELQC